MNLAQIESFLDQGLQFVQKAAPLIGQFTGPAGAAIAETVATVAGTADVMLKEVEADAAVIASGDVARIKELQTRLQAENAQLAAQIAAT